MQACGCSGQNCVYSPTIALGWPAGGDEVKKVGLEHWFCPFATQPKPWTRPVLVVNCMPSIQSNLLPKLRAFAL